MWIAREVCPYQNDSAFFRGFSVPPESATPRRVNTMPQRPIQDPLYWSIHVRRHMRRHAIPHHQSCTNGANVTSVYAERSWTERHSPPPRVSNLLKLKGGRGNDLCPPSQAQPLSGPRVAHHPGGTMRRVMLGHALEHTGGGAVVVGEGGRFSSAR